MRFEVLLTLFSLCVITIGCGGGPDLGTPVDVSGKVTLDGEPLSNHMINFYNPNEGAPAEHRFFEGEIGSDGSYTVSGVYPGDYVVSVHEPESDNAEGEEVVAEEKGPLAKYQSNSPLTASVSESQASFNFDLTSD